MTFFLYSLEYFENLLDIDTTCTQFDYRLTKAKEEMEKQLQVNLEELRV